jgi:hypothetical protein
MKVFFSLISLEIISSGKLMNQFIFHFHSCLFYGLAGERESKRKETARQVK